MLINDELKSKQLSSKQSATSSNNAKKRKKRDSASSDEERWLTAIESGKLEDVDDELKKIKPKDPALMTARQRAMYDRGLETSSGGTPTLMSLPTGYKEKVMTAEAIQKAAIKSQKRKQMADEKREKDKKKTMERLLKKQESKVAKSVKAKTSKTSAPVVIYRQNVFGRTLTFPENMDFPLKDCRIKEPPKPVLCSMNCGGLKRYSCSKTGVPLCSFECYKSNLKKSSF
ncbi:INO80 complex subunit B [Onthophagus taurus]|uniref:INO80 complex subunit B n=1 Tax=Onthophagus taurus TaxID=166361 RepID=UPI000C20DEF2|nr:INO80 complex subunit B [Onthophagus taurus]